MLDEVATEAELLARAPRLDEVDEAAAELGADLALAGGARLLVGPEGGLTADETEALLAADFGPIALGPYTLRSGTAALVGLARLMFAASPCPASPGLAPTPRPASPA